jgi:PAS domain-containing protein
MLARSGGGTVERLFAKTDAFDDAMAFFSGGKFLYANGAFLALFGYDDLAQLVGRSIGSVTAPGGPHGDYMERIAETPQEALSIRR